MIGDRRLAIGGRSRRGGPRAVVGSSIAGGRFPIGVALLLVAAGCAPPVLHLPSGPGAAAPDAAAILDQATSACRGVRTLTAEIGVAGRIHGQKIRGRLAAGFAAPGSVRIEAVAPFGPPMFVFVADDDRGSLVLPRDDRYISNAPPASLLDAVAGVPFGPAELEAILSGCGAAQRDATGGKRFGNDWLVVDVHGDREFYLQRAGDAWHVAAVTVAGSDPVRIEYRDFQSGLPRTVRLTANAAGMRAPAYDVTLVLSQVDVNTPLGADAFRVQIPKTAQPITIDELRRNGPLAERGREE